ELYNLLLKPAEAQLRTKTRLIIVPDGPLWDLCFQALQTRQNRYLIENHTIFYAPSLTVLLQMIQERAKAARPSTVPSLLALGNPALGEQTIGQFRATLMAKGPDPLPDSEQEVKALGRIYGYERSKVYVGTEAREERFKLEAGGFQILHLATHGILNN